MPALRILYHSQLTTSQPALSAPLRKSSRENVGQRLDAFGQRDIKVRDKAHQSAKDGGSPWIVGQVRDKAPIGLDFVDSEAAQITQRRIPRAEIADRELHPQRGKGW